MGKKQYSVIVETGIEDAPKDHEMSAAIILKEYFKADVIFLRPLHSRTPDLEIQGIRWEVKSPMGDGRRTIDNNFREARG